MSGDVTAGLRRADIGGESEPTASRMSPRRGCATQQKREGSENFFPLLISFGNFGKREVKSQWKPMGQNVIWKT
jgi:hypothetical protein